MQAPGLYSVPLSLARSVTTTVTATAATGVCLISPLLYLDIAVAEAQCPPRSSNEDLLAVAGMRYSYRL